MYLRYLALAQISNTCALRIAATRLAAISLLGEHRQDCRKSVHRSRGRPPSLGHAPARAKFNGFHPETCKQSQATICTMPRPNNPVMVKYSSHACSTTHSSRLSPRRCAHVTPVAGHLKLTIPNKFLINLHRCCKDRLLLPSERNCETFHML